MRQNSASISSTLGSGPWYWHSLRFFELGSAENSCAHKQLLSLASICLPKAMAVSGQVKDNIQNLSGHKGSAALSILCYPDCLQEYKERETLTKAGPKQDALLHAPYAIPA